MSESKSIISVLVKNHSGVLLRVAGLFSRRGFNIDSIIACQTENPAFSRLTIVITGDEAVFAQLTRQLYKLEDVIKVRQMEIEDSSCCELIIVKVSTAGAGRSAVIRMIQGYGARVLDIGDAAITLEMTALPDELDDFVKQLERYGVLELARTGLNALQCGDHTIHDEIQ